MKQIMQNTTPGMKIPILLTTLMLVFVTAQAQHQEQSPFSNCWLFQDTVTAGYITSTKVDSIGRVFMTLYDNSISKNIILDESGNMLSTSSTPINAVTLSGNFFNWYSITDSTTSTLDVVIEKYSPLNNLIWRDTIGYGNNSYDYIYGLTVTGEDLIVTGSSWNASEAKGLIFKLDQSGNVAWTDEVDSPGPVIILSTGNYLLEGVSLSDNITVTNITPEGQILWHTTLNSLYYPTPSGLMEGTNGGCYALTTTTDWDNPYANQIVIVDHLDLSGNKSPGTKYLYNENISVAKTDSKGNLLLSSWEDYFGDVASASVWKFNQHLDMLWHQQTDQYFPYIADMLIDLHGNVYWLINSADFDNANQAYLYKYDPDGILQWQFIKSGSNSNRYYAQSLDLRNNDHLLLLGSDGQYNPLLNLESIAWNGTSEWEQPLDTINPGYADLVKLNDDEYYLPGSYYQTETHSGLFCLKLCAQRTSCATEVKITPLGNLDLCETGLVKLQASSADNYTYQWNRNQVDIPGATNQVYHAIKTGNYRVRVVDAAGCHGVSKKTTVYTSCKLDQQQSDELVSKMKLYPNPTNEQFVIAITLADDVNALATIQVINTLGQVVHDEITKMMNGTLQREIQLSDAADGIYLVKVIINDQMYSSQISYQK